MANPKLYIGGDVGSFMIGADDCHIYLGDELMYPLSTPIPPTYLTFEAQDDGFTFQLANDSEYSTDGGESWTELYGWTESPEFTSGTTIMLRGNILPDAYSGVGSLTTNGRYKAYGNPLSLIVGDNYQNATVANYSSAFNSLFAYNTGLTDASDIQLPSTALSYSCYSSMFNGCTSLTSAPALPATTLADNCYDGMFNGCTSLTTAPELPATALTDACYSSMFYGCTSLTTAPELPATALVDNCYMNMFRGCTSLTAAPELSATTMKENCYDSMFYGCSALTTVQSVLPATTLADYCYRSMFRGCDSLTAAPELPATALTSNCYETMFESCDNLTSAPALPAMTLTPYCYHAMFQRCTSLVHPPALPATTLEAWCYESMFYQCTSLATAPELPAKTLKQYCCRNMFSGCQLINEMTCLATDISASNCTWGWLTNVSPTGTFHPDPSMASTWSRGDGGIPTGWNIDAPTDYSTKYLTIEALNNYVSVSYSGKGLGSVSYSVDNGATWASWSNSGGTKGLNSGQKMILKATKTPATNAGIGTIKITGPAPSGQPTPKAKIYGNPLSLLYGDNFTGHTGTIPNSAFDDLFAGSKNLVDASNLILPTMTLSQGCYGCMFIDCIRLTSAPVLSATTLAANCYIQMFEGCTSLTSVKCLATNISASNCTAHWLRNVAANGTFTKATSMSSWTTGENGIPSGWTVQNAS